MLRDLSNEVRSTGYAGAQQQRKQSCVFAKPIESEQIAKYVDLSGTLRLTKFVPPDFGFGRAIPHLRQFLLDLQQAPGAHIGSHLLNGAVHALLRIQTVHIPQVGYFLT
jgi:hypothetical protein